MVSGVITVIRCPKHTHRRPIRKTVLSPTFDMDLAFVGAIVGMALVETPYSNDNKNRSTTGVNINELLLSLLLARP